MAWYFHYTTRAAAQGVVTTGTLRPGRSGNVYLTPDLYSHGAEATSKLATVPHQPREGLLAVPRHVVENLAASLGTVDLTPSPVHPLYLAGRLLCPGGGAEVILPSPVPMPPGTPSFGLNGP